VAYTVWKLGEKIGETRFELSPGPRKRAGVFHPTAFGMTLLPAITAMAPALVEFEALCRERGMSADLKPDDATEAALDAIANTPQGKRVLTAASHVADLELRDPAGHTLCWESIMISDMTGLAELAGRRRTGASAQFKMLPGDPIRFMISTTLAPPTTPRPTNPLGAGESAGIC
jgi:hypothetical protein